VPVTTSTAAIPPVSPRNPTSTGSIFVEACDQADGPLAGWQSDPRRPAIQVVRGRCSTEHNTSPHAGRATHGLDLSGSFSIEARVVTPKISGDGGVNIWLLDATGNGWGVFVGNAVHIQKITAYEQTNVTNVGVPGEATTGVRSAVVRLTRDGATGVISAYLDGQPWGHITETGRVDVGSTVVVILQNAHSPAYETELDDLRVTNESSGG
jgi:hypothetical protein